MESDVIVSDGVVEVKMSVTVEELAVLLAVKLGADCSHRATPAEVVAQDVAQQTPRKPTFSEFVQKHSPIRTHAPKRKHQRWTQEEIKELREGLNEGRKTSAIARQLRRTPAAVATKAWELDLRRKRNKKQ